MKPSGLNRMSFATMQRAEVRAAAPPQLRWVALLLLALFVSSLVIVAYHNHQGNVPKKACAICKTSNDLQSATVWTATLPSPVPTATDTLAAAVVPLTEEIHRFARGARAPPA